MKLSRKPKTLAILMVTAVLLLSMVAVAGAWYVNFGTLNPNGYDRTDSISGTIYQSGSIGEQTYAKVYTVVNGIVQSTLAADGVQQGDTVRIPFLGWPVGVNSVSLAVYDSDGVSPYVYRNNDGPFNVRIIAGTSTPGSGGGGGGSTTPTTPPTVNATFGTPVSVSVSTGATINNDAVTITIPAGAMGADFKVTITKLADITGLTIPETSQLLSDVLEIIKDKDGNFDKAVTLTMKFDPSKVDTTKYDVKICYYDETNDTWVPLDNISADIDKGTVSGDVTHFTKFAVLAVPKAAPAPTVTLSDISGHWAEASIQQLVYAGAITGYPDGTFKPDNTITRAEFATVLVKAFKLTAQEGKVFDDTASHWAKDYIATAAAAGIVNGYSATAFGPNDLITREQMAVMIARAADLTQATAEVTFTDKVNIASWAADAVASASEAQIITGYPDNSFKPQGNATRAEAVTVIVKALK